MVTQKMYKYLGRNGTILSPVELVNTDPIPMIQIKAIQGKILTNGISKVYSVIIFEDEIDNWTEIDDEGQD